MVNYQIILYCTECNEKCTSTEETFDYSGTHCNNGIAGTHHTGHYVSDCCLADVTSEEPETTEQDSEGTMKYNDYEQVNGATVNALLERIEKLERMLIVINESWSVEDYVEGELFDEIIKEIGQSVDTHATTEER